MLPALPAAAQDGEAAPVAQQGGDTPADSTVPEEQFDEDTIVVLGALSLGAVEAAQPPVLELGEEDIAAYGVGSIAELIQQLGPQVTSARGRGGGGFPVILVNGVRISSFREMRSYPPEAIEKFEVFPEEVALQYGYSPDQRVVNIILKDNFSSREIELEYGQPFDGGYSTQEVEGTYLRIDGPSRLNVNVEWNNSSSLTEADRGVVQSFVPTFATDPDPALYRSLVSDTAGLEGTINWSTTLGAGNSLSVNATYEREDSLRLQGLDSVTLFDPVGERAFRTFNAADPLTVDNRNQSYSTGSTLNLGLGDWEVTGTVDATLSKLRTLTARRVDTSALVADAAAGTLALDGDLGSFTDAGFDEALTDTYTVNALATGRTNPFVMPAGDVSLTLSSGARWNGIDSSDTRNPGVETELSRTRLFGSVNVGIPLTSRDEEFLGFIGDLSLNLSARVDDLSDFGTLYDWNSTLVWGVTDSLTFNATYINRDEAPSLSMLGSPEVATPNVSIFDLVNNETVLATVITGGNAFLPAQNQSDWKIGLQWQLPILDQASFSVDYIDNSSTDVASGFPLLTEDIEAAFPDRFVRDGSGTLVQLDQRPVTFAREDQRRLQFGLNLSGQIGGGGDDNAASGGGAAVGGPVGGPVGGQGGAQFGGQGGPPAGFRPDPERFAQMRATFCEAEPDVLRGQMNAVIAAAANGEDPPVGEDGQPINLPPQMLERLAGEDGVIDEAEFATMRERICSADGPPQFAGGAPGAGGRPQGAPEGGPPAGARGGGRGGPPGLPFGRGGPGGGGGRWFVNLQYNYELQNEVLIADGLPLLDLLDGDGNQSRHSADLRVGTFYNGFGMIWSGRYTGSATLDGSGDPGSTDLTFNDYVTFDVRAFADLGQREKLVEAVPFLKGSRIGIAVDNIFDARQRVTDSTGSVPIRYQPFLIDPTGRSFEIEFRKLF
ncbi:TonB-dependent receptor plug domain-containing protein [Alteraurantiacibacter aquimixticola]|uniref:TonB-dependent receptor n=1 Tax=Alteraurantiacibacter aquimixticola TaxID=2489173 RepID=A0A4T3F9P8_9SPHN|nr:TonB-dependent receptor plug domain-containing protein [Alteraurantiacibacter aquimixticola]TIX51750.1 hypothetical protein E5222_04695 [Alteraurantiacibacter aquimixticola]